MESRAHRIARLLAAAACLGVVSTAGAVDGVVLIDQNRALAGNVTPGDTPGFPVTISVSGSYRLSSNLTVPDQNTTAIDITTAAAAVTIDLNGFAIQGPTACDISIPTVCAPVAADPSNVFGPGVGVRSLASASLTVRNGTIRGMGRYAVFIAAAPISTIDGLQIRDCGLGGMHLGITNVYNSNITRNGGNGIANNQGVIKGNLVTRNAGAGIVSTGFPLTILDNQIGQNGGAGIDFAATGSYGNNTIYNNLGGQITGSGIQVSGNVCNGSPCP